MVLLNCGIGQICLKKCLLDLLVMRINTRLRQNAIIIEVFAMKRLYFAYLSFYHEKAINALCELAEELPVICLPHQDGGIDRAKCLSQRHNK